jgi:hypothetical protein
MKQARQAEALPAVAIGVAWLVPGAGRSEPPPATTEDADAVLDSYGIVGDHLSLTYQRHAITQIRVADLDGLRGRVVELPGIGNADGIFGERDKDTAFSSTNHFCTADDLSHLGRGLCPA